MALQLSVPTIACSGCAETITEAIKNLDTTAVVQVEVTAKIVKVETQASDAAVKAAIVATGHTIA